MNNKIEINIMIKRCLLTLTLSLVSQNSIAIMGVGDIVSDPVSYTYYGRQIEKSIEAVKTAQEHAKTALETKDLAVKTVKNLEGSLKRAQRAVDSFKRFHKRLKDDPWTAAEEYIKDPDDITKDLNRYYSKASRAIAPSVGDYNDWRELFGDEGEDINPLPERPNWLSTKQAQDRHLTNELNNALLKSVKADALINLSLEDLQELSEDANTALTQKDATDVGNAVLLKISEQMQQLIELLSSANRSITYIAQNTVKPNKGEALQELKTLDDEYNNGALNSDEQLKNHGDSIKLFGGKSVF